MSLDGDRSSRRNLLQFAANCFEVFRHCLRLDDDVRIANGIEITTEVAEDRAGIDASVDA